MIPYRVVVKKNSFRAYGTFAILVLAFLVFAWEMFITTQEGKPIEELLPAYALQTCDVGNISPSELVLDGTRSLFMHTSFSFFVTNMLFLWIFAPLVEQFFGHRKFILFYLVGGFGGHIFSTLFSAQDCMVLVGANGAISAVLGAFFFLHPFKLVDAFVPIVNRTFALPAILFMLAYLAIMVFSSQGGPLSGDLAPYWDEVGGFIMGFSMMFFATLFKSAPPADPFEYLDR